MMNESVLLLLGWSFCFATYGYIFFYAHDSGEGELPVMVLPMVAGIIFENWRLSRNWKAIQIKLLVALLGSLFAFAYGKGEVVYDFERHLSFWPFFFIFLFVMYSVFFHEDRSVVGMGKGVTLLQTTALIYLLIEREWYAMLTGMWAILLVVVGIFTAFTLYRAFSKRKLADQQRLALSLWSSLIMLIFSADLIYRVLISTPSEPFLSTNGLLAALQFFLLGVSSIYILRNLQMLAIYLPHDGHFYGGTHRAIIKKLNKLHIARYSKSLLPTVDAVILLLLALLLYSLNYIYAFLPDYTLIWTVFWISPLLISLRRKHAKS
ncbi:MAG: hypothetical protein ABR572_11160 [Cryomorphaceae bacterium]